MAEQEVFDRLKEGLLAYDAEGVGKAAQEVVDGGLDVLKAIDVLTSTIRELGAKFEAGEAFLPELMMGAEAMKAGTAVLTPAIPKGAKTSMLGTFVLGTVKGDIHDIGTTIVGTMLSAAGFEVVDIGVDQPPSAFAEAAERNRASIVGASALMSTTRPGWKDIIEYFKALGIRDKYKIMVGGGGEYTRGQAEEVGADGFGKDVAEAVRVATKLVGR